MFQWPNDRSCRCKRLRELRHRVERRRRPDRPSGFLCGRWRWRRRGRFGLVRGRPLLFNRRANCAYIRARVVHQHRVTRDIETDRSSHAVVFPGRPSVRIAAADKAIIVAFVAGSLTSAEARNVVQHFGMASGKGVDGADDLRRTSRCKSADRQRRQVALIRGRRRGELNDRRLGRIRDRRCRSRCRRGCRGLSRLIRLTRQSSGGDCYDYDRDPRRSTILHVLILTPVDIHTPPPVI